MEHVLGLLKRGALAGAAAGVAAGLFGLVLAEPALDRAVALETARQAAGGHALDAEVFTRSQQHAGLVLASLLTGLAFGVLLAVLYAVLHRRDPQVEPWRRSLALGGAAAFGLWLVPFLRYPAMPPGVGDPDTVGRRTTLWLMALTVGVVGAALASQGSAALRRRGARDSTRQLVVLLVCAAALALSFVLPPDNDVVNVPARLLWEFRLLSAGTSIVLWGTLTAVFGLMGEHQSWRLMRAGVPAGAEQATAS